MANDRHHVPGHGVAQAFALDSKTYSDHPLPERAAIFPVVWRDAPGSRARNRNPGGLFSRAAAGGTAHFFLYAEARPFGGHALVLLIAPQFRQIAVVIKRGRALH